MKSNKVDAYTQHTLSNIKPEVFKTLNLVQLEAIRQAISTNAPFRQHPIDIRIVPWPIWSLAPGFPAHFCKAET